MSMLFTPGRIGTLQLPNRLIRSATAERMANSTGRSSPKLRLLYQELAEGGVGLIITGHMYVHPMGKAHPEMTGIFEDELIPNLKILTEAVHEKNGRIVAQLNHGGLKCSQEVVQEVSGPSEVIADFLRQPKRELTSEEILDLARTYGHAARRAKTAGFDGVQIHAAHGYLINQFLSPISNQRSDQWGGKIENRMRFLREVSRAIREQVGPDYPVLIKLGMMDDLDGGLTPEEGTQVVAELEGMGINGVEISGGFDLNRRLNIRKGIRSELDEAYFLPLAKSARKVTNLPIILVGGFRTRLRMEQVLADGQADFISLCRPFILEPDLPEKFRLGLQEKSRCISANNCWPIAEGEGIACKCPLENNK